MNKVLAIFVFYSEDGQHLSRPDAENPSSKQIYAHEMDASGLFRPVRCVWNGLDLPCQLQQLAGQHATGQWLLVYTQMTAF